MPLYETIKSPVPFWSFRTHISKVTDVNLLVVEVAVVVTVVLVAVEVVVLVVLSGVSAGIVIAWLRNKLLPDALERVIWYL